MIVYKPKGRAAEYANWALNLYQGCGHACEYCYAPRVLHMDKETFQNMPEPRKDILERLDKECRTGKNKGKQVLLCFTCDPYQPLEKEAQITRQAIQMLHNGGARVTVLTKAPTLALRDIDILLPGDELATTLTFNKANHQKSLQWEPWAELPHQRMLGLQEFNRQGWRTWVSLEPVIEPESTKQAILESHHFVDFYKVGKLNYAKSDVNWAKFAGEVVGLLERLGKAFLVKEDLKEYL